MFCAAGKHFQSENLLKDSKIVVRESQRVDIFCELVALSLAQEIRKIDYNNSIQRLNQNERNGFNTFENDENREVQCKKRSTTCTVSYSLSLLVDSFSHCGCYFHFQ